MSQKTWDEYFLEMAEFVAKKSKDPSTKVGAVIVSDDHSILSTGYNGFPRGVRDIDSEELSVDDVNDRTERPNKYFYTEHAERNAIYNAARHGIKLEGSIIYVSGGGNPCSDCVRAIIQSGIKKVITRKGDFEGKGDWKKNCDIGREMLYEAKVFLEKINQYD